MPKSQDPVQKVLQKLDQHDQQFQQIVTVLQEHGKLLSRLDVKVDHLETRFDHLTETVEAGFEDVKEDIGLLKKSLQQAFQRIGSLM